MRRSEVRASSAVVIAFVLGTVSTAQATCPALPNSFANGQVADAAQVMANFNALLNCINSGAGTPAGSANALQYDAGGGSFGGVGPLTNGQLVIGSTGSVPQAGTLTAGNGIVITNGTGSATIATIAPPSPSGLYRQVMSAKPTIASTGLATWLNRGAAFASDRTTGISISAPPTSISAYAPGHNADLRVRYKSAPAIPYSIKTYVVLTHAPNTEYGWFGTTNLGQAGVGWYDNTSGKLETISFSFNEGWNIRTDRWNSAESSGGYTYRQAGPVGGWLRIRDDGTNVYFQYSKSGDDNDFITLYSVAKANGWLGSNGYSNVVFFVNRTEPSPSTPTIGTLMSWSQGG